MQRQSLRDEALARQAAHQQAQQQKHMMTMMQQPNATMQTQTQTQTQFYNNTNYNNPNNSMTAEEARQKWRQHGEGLTQSLEDRRTQLSNMNTHNNAAGSALLNGGAAYPQQKSFSIRVIGAEDRIDPAGSVFTAYLIEVERNNNNNNNNNKQVVEHRYSEFAKLNRALEVNDVQLRSSFPTKVTLWGRIANWTPSLHFDPEKRHELVTYRKIKLDIWLVELVEKLMRGEIPCVELRDRVEEFLSQSSAFCPPCDRANAVDWSPLTKRKSSSSSSSSSTNSSTANTQSNTNNNIRSCELKNPGGIERHIANPVSFTLGGEIRKASYTVLNMCGKGRLASDRSIPLDLLHQARGLCFLTVAKAGLIVTGRIGTGLIVARQADGGWSPPSAMGTVGLGWGAQIGADITSYLIVLTTDEAVKAFASRGSINLGAELDVAVGPFGRSAKGNVNAGDGGFAPAYSYAHSKGFFAGISLEGSILASRSDVNSKFYGRPVQPMDLLHAGATSNNNNAQLSRPRAAQPLYDALNEALGVPIVGFRPSELGKKHGNGYYQNAPARSGSGNGNTNANTAYTSSAYVTMQQAALASATVIPPSSGAVIVDGVPYATLVHQAANVMSYSNNAA